VKKSIYFDAFDGPGWPPSSDLKQFFLAPRGKEWSFRGGNDSWGLDIHGLDGTENLPHADAVNVDWYMTGHRDHGVYLLYSKWDGRTKQRASYHSKGDLRRLRETIRSLHGTPLPVGLFVPFATAWKAVEEFMETNGELPKSIEWIAGRDLPPNTFPDP
jgi:hypothetical protein